MLNRLGATIVLVVTVMSWTGHNTSAEQPGDLGGKKQLHPDELVARVLESNAGLRGMAAAAEAARYRVAPAGALDDPTVTYAGAPKTAGGSRGLQQRLELSQTLPWPGKRALREDEARARAEGDRHALQQRRLVLTSAAKHLFAEWAYVHRTQQILQEHKTLLQELTRVTESQYAAGTGSQQDTLKVQVQAARIDTAIIAHTRHRQEVRARINGLLNQPPQTPLPPPASLPKPGAPPDLATLRELALQQHPELARIRSDIKAAEAKHGLASKDYYPDFKVFGGYNSLWNDPDQRLTLGVTINLPVDFSDKRSNAVSEAHAEKMRYQWELTDREAQLIARLEEDLARVQEARQLIDVHQERLLPLAEANLNAAIADYRAGRGSFLNVIDAERQQLRSEDDLARAHADYVRELAALERDTGRSLNGVHADAPEQE